jgi:hypothetical protein
MSSIDDIVIISRVLTPFSKFGGALKESHCADPGVIIIKIQSSG